MISWERSVNIGGTITTEVQYLATQLNRWRENEKPLSQLAREITDELPPSSEGETRSFEAVRSKLRRMLDGGYEQIEETQTAEVPPQLLTALGDHAAPIIDGVRSPSTPPMRWIEMMIELQEMINESDPIITTAEATFEVDHPIAVIFMSDVHLGGRYTAYPEFRSLLERVMEIPNLYVGLHGDNIEGFLTSFRSARAVMDQLVPVPMQRRIIKEVVQMLIDSEKLLYGCKGEHDGLWFESAVGESPFKEQYLAGGIPYYDGKGTYIMNVGDQTYLLGVAHQWPGSSQYNPNHSQSRALKWDLPQADVIAQGHRHTSAVQRITAYPMEMDAKIRPWPHAFFVQAGTAKNGPDPYSVRGWAKGQFDWPVLVFYPDRHWIKWAQDIDDLEMYLAQ